MFNFLNAPNAHSTTPAKYYSVMKKYMYIKVLTHANRCANKGYFSMVASSKRLGGGSKYLQNKIVDL